MPSPSKRPHTVFQFNQTLKIDGSHSREELATLLSPSYGGRIYTYELNGNTYLCVEGVAANTIREQLEGKIKDFRGEMTICLLKRELEAIESGKEVEPKPCLTIEGRVLAKNVRTALPKGYKGKLIYRFDRDANTTFVEVPGLSKEDIQAALHKAGLIELEEKE